MLRRIEVRNECLTRAARLCPLAAALCASTAIAQPAPPTTGVEVTLPMSSDR